MSCINDDRIDWTGLLPFTAAGGLDVAEAERRRLQVNYSAKPIPIIAAGSDEHQQLREAVAGYERMLRPASDKELLFELKKLSCHCGMANRDAMDFEMMLDDYLTDLAEYPIDLVREACRKYRNDPDKNHDFFPRPGKLKPLMDAELYRRRHQYRRLSKLLDVAENPPPPPPPLTFDDVLKQERQRIEVERMMAELSGKKREPPPAYEAHIALVNRVEAAINTAQKSRLITESEAREMLNQLAAFHQKQSPTSEDETHGCQKEKTEIP